MSDTRTNRGAHPQPKPRLPPRLRPGDCVALVAPGGALDPHRIRGAASLLESRGLKVGVREDITERHRYLAGNDERRARELFDALTDPGVKGVFLARGGYGSQRILEGLRPAGLQVPRAVVGFSDNTALLNYLRQRCGWAVLHGPHPRPDSPEELDSVLGCFGYYGEPARTAAVGLQLWNPRPWERVLAEVGGGCLSILSSSAGTAYAFSGRRKIVFIEEVREPVYRIDRMLHHLRACGALEGAAAVVFGRLESFLSERDDLNQLEQLLEEFAASAPFPVLSGLPCGHTHPNLPLPFGPRALLDAGVGSLTFTEGMVR